MKNSSPANDQDTSELPFSRSTSRSKYLDPGDRVTHDADQSRNDSETSETSALIPTGNMNGRRVEIETPLPKSQLFVLSLIIFSEPMNSTILLPFVYFMVRDFGVSKDEKDIGRYAGLIASSFFFSQFCFSIFWGYMSDRYGRRPILLLGLLGNMVTCILFGLSRSLIWAIASRSACGMLNGNVGVAKSMLGELTDKTNQTKAFSIFGFCWGVGCIVGPVTGGYLSNPADNFPLIFGNCTFLKAYPYFLPCAVAALVSIIGFTVGFFMLPESHYPNARNQDPKDKSLRCSNATQKSPDSNSNGCLYTHKSYGAINPCDNDVSCSQGSRDFGLPKPHNYNNNASPKMKASASDTEEGCSYPDDLSATEVKSDKREIDSFFGIPAVSWTSIISYAVLSFHVIFFDELYTLYAVTAIQFGGLGFRATKLARSLAIMGGVQLISQFIIFPWITRRFDMLKLYRICWFTFVPVYLLFPVINKLEIFLSKNEIRFGDTIVWYFLLLALTARYFLNVCTFTPVMIFVNNSATSDILGTVNGIGQTLASFVRFMGPALGGFLWSWSLTNHLGFPFDNFFAFIMLSVASLIGGFQCLMIPREVSNSGCSDDEEEIILLSE